MAPGTDDATIKFALELHSRYQYGGTLLPNNIMPVVRNCLQLQAGHSDAQDSHHILLLGSLTIT